MEVKVVTENPKVRIELRLEEAAVLACIIGGMSADDEKSFMSKTTRSYKQFALTNYNHQIMLDLYSELNEIIEEKFEK